MKFAVVVHGGPQSSEANLTALAFCEAVLRGGHEIYRVFFYHEGVLAGNRLAVIPQDEPRLLDRWMKLATANNLELVVCVASALRRGMVDEAESNRNDFEAISLAAPFTISGLGQLIDAGLSADKLVTFQP